MAREFRREDDFIGWLRHQRATRGCGLVLGIGDDTALVRPSPGRELILTSDWTIEGVHFRRALHPAGSVGHRALARSLSDIAAMGGRPRWVLVSLAIPADIGAKWVKGMYAGLSRLARRFGVAIAGGDTSVVPDRISIDVVVLGEVLRGRALRRSGARPGDQIFVSGRLGLSALGLRVLESSGKTLRGPVREALRAHLYPEPHCALGEFLSGNRLASSMMDVSDGLSTDLARLCRASGVGARVWESLLPMPTVAAVSSPSPAVAAMCHRRRRTPARRGPEFAATTDVAGAERSSAVERAVATQDPLALALHGGEDYQLLFTVPARKAAKVPRHFGGVPLNQIGIIERGNAVCLVRASARVEPLQPAGFDHFRLVR